MEELKKQIMKESGLQLELRQILVEVIDSAYGGTSSVAWSNVTGKPNTFPPAIGTTSTTAMAGNTPIPSAPSAGTAAQLQTGTDTAQRTWSAKMIHDEIARQITAIGG